MCSAIAAKVDPVPALPARRMAVRNRAILECCWWSALLLVASGGLADFCWEDDGCVLGGNECRRKGTALAAKSYGREGGGGPALGWFVFASPSRRSVAEGGSRAVQAVDTLSSG